MLRFFPSHHCAPLLPLGIRPCLESSVQASGTHRNSVATVNSDATMTAGPQPCSLMSGHCARPQRSGKPFIHRSKASLRQRNCGAVGSNRTAVLCVRLLSAACSIHVVPLTHSAIVLTCKHHARAVQLIFQKRDHQSFAVCQRVQRPSHSANLFRCPSCAQLRPDIWHARSCAQTTAKSCACCSSATHS